MPENPDESATPVKGYFLKDAEHAASLFNMERGGHVYSRISRPTAAAPDCLRELVALARQPKA